MAKVEIVRKHAASTVGEGPHWVEDEQSLLYVDIMAGGVNLWNTQTNSQVSVEFADSYATFAVPHRKGGIVAGIGQKFMHFNWSDVPSERKVIAEVDQEKGPSTRLNDGKCDSAGRIFSGTMAIETSPAVLAPNLGSLYSLDKDGEVRNRMSPVTLSNGLGWTKDARTMFFVDSLPGYLYAFDYDINTADITNQRIVYDFSKTPKLGIPDGLCMDTDDNIWIACYSVGMVIQIDPQVGKILRTIEIPAKRVTSCCFGGKNYDELYVTSSCYGYTKEEMAAKDPLGGTIFKVSGLGVKGLPGVSYDGI